MNVFCGVFNFRTNAINQKIFMCSIYQKAVSNLVSGFSYEERGGYTKKSKSERKKEVANDFSLVAKRSREFNTINGNVLIIIFDHLF